MQLYVDRRHVWDLARSGSGGAVGLPAANAVYAAVWAARLAVSEVTLAVRVALFSMSWLSVVFSVVAAAARLSRYLT